MLFIFSCASIRLLIINKINIIKTHRRTASKSVFIKSFNKLSNSGLLSSGLITSEREIRQDLYEVEILSLIEDHPITNARRIIT